MPQATRTDADGPPPSTGNTPRKASGPLSGLTKGAKAQLQDDSDNTAQKQACATAELALEMLAAQETFETLEMFEAIEAREAEEAEEAEEEEAEEAEEEAAVEARAQAEARAQSERQKTKLKASLAEHDKAEEGVDRSSERARTR
ncbi:hypothetical protein [Ralstonia syzygii]|uniref:hypothetical protein n=1 Tax=Ralstonia syzygii TaxID=28097 RepID=UPI0018D122B9|nr:hypothetical protein [Ralstonia syzygii]